MLRQLLLGLFLAALATAAKFKYQLERVESIKSQLIKQEVAIGLGRPGPAGPGDWAGPGLSRFEKALGRPDRFGPSAGPTLSARPGPESR
ncbi:unnamed protein product [Bursaphelenchus xylophilus]|nr:unnamed protein product [Bursaphelenchus xylophilus]CAG9118300.1 unnamed protein product [Bursaphelenchus xylophilus]